MLQVQLHRYKMTYVQGLLRASICFLIRFSKDDMIADSLGENTQYSLLAVIKACWVNLVKPLYTS